MNNQASGLVPSSSWASVEQDTEPLAIRACKLLLNIQTHLDNSTNLLYCNTYE